jgi:signal transduction histidine kinase
MRAFATIWALHLALLVCARSTAAAVATRPPLTTAADAVALSAEAAGMRLPIDVTGVVTAAEPGWRGQFFVQDATAGIFVENLDAPAPRPGDLVRVQGESHPGAFAPIISRPNWELIGTGELPAARAVSIEEVVAGVEDSQRVEIVGIVRAASVVDDRLAVDLSVAGYRLRIHAPAAPETDPRSLVAARVRVRGTAATHYNTALRHLLSVAVYVPRAEDFTVLERETIDPFSRPAIPISTVAQYRHGSGSGQRVGIRGVLTLQRPGELMFLQDETGGIRVHTTTMDTFTPGTTLSAAGFIEYRDLLPLLVDAEIRPVDVASTALAPLEVPFAELQRGQHHGDRIRMRGRLLDRSSRPFTRPDGAPETVTTWLVQGDDITFTVEHRSAPSSEPPSVGPAGSTIEIDGVCMSTVDTTGKLLSLALLLHDASDIRIVRRPSLLTPERLLAGVGVLSVVLVVTGSWLLTVSRKNAVLEQLVREREHAQRALQDAHDTLEQKVVERSNQLRVEMSARRTAEVQFKAVLAERTRLARDLHDTLEQTLTGIALRLETAARLAPRDSVGSASQLQFSRNLLHQSQVELRRSIWDLRSRELERFDLGEALRHSAAHMVEAAGGLLDFRIHGTRTRLPEIAEENALRVGQEALTNIVKHARATTVTIELVYAPEKLVLRVADDGTGFDLSVARSAAQGHFGLIGMQERAKRLGGTLEVASVADQGTTVTLELPLDAVPEEHLSETPTSPATQ